MKVNKPCHECINCGNATSRKTYCSIPCETEFIKKRNIELGKIKSHNLVCKNCKKIFTSTYSKGVYCSKSCSRIYKKNNRLTYQSSSLIGFRFKILKRDNFTCHYCGRNFLDDKKVLMIDHIIPRNKGGKDTDDNLITSCSDCNIGKSDILLDIHQINKLKEHITHE